MLPIDSEPCGSLRIMIGWLFNWKLVDLRQYIETVREALQHKLDALGAEFDERTKDMTEAQRNWYAEQETGDAVQLAEDFPALVWQTSFIHMYFHLEHGLIDLCKTVKQAGKFTEDITGEHKGIVAAQRFMTKVAGLPFPFQGKVYGRMWRDLLQMNELRNIFAHEMGQIKDEPSKELKQYIKRKGTLMKVDDLGRISFTADYCFESIELIRKFYEAVLASVPDRLIP